LSFFDRQVLSVLAPEILADLNITTVEYARAISAFTLAYSIMFSVGGRLVDRLGTRLGLGLSVTFWSLASLLHTLTRGSGQLAAFRFLLGAAEGGCFPGAAKGVLEWFPARERALAMGIATTAGSAVGAVLAPPLIVWTAAYTGWRGAFAVTGLIGLVWIALWFALYRLPEASPFATPTERAYILSDRMLPKSGNPEAPWPLRRLLIRKDVWGVTATRFLLDPVFYFYMFWIPQYLHQERGASLEEIGRLTWIPFLSLGIASLLAGLVSDKLVRRGWPVGRARKTIMGAAAFLTPVSILALYAPNSFWAVVLLGVLMFAHGFWMTNYMTLIGDLFPSANVATVVGLTGTAGGLGGALSSLLIGQVIQAWSFAPVFVVCGLLYPVGLAVLLVTV
jgi:MFS transporter, ACS family, aldohexuronate transporter